MKVADPVTTKILKPIKDFLSNNPSSIINIAWDEVFIFMPWINNWEEKIISEISESFKNNDLKARITHSYDNDISFDNLDFLTEINKIFEEKLENTKFWLTKNIILNISDELKKEILYSQNILSNNDSSLQTIQTIKDKIEIINFNSDFIKNNDETKIYYDNWWLKIEIIKKDNRYEIYIKKS
jgi:hypothetical protein